MRRGRGLRFWAWRFGILVHECVGGIGRKNTPSGWLRRQERHSENGRWTEDFGKKMIPHELRLREKLAI